VSLTGRWEPRGYILPHLLIIFPMKSDQGMDIRYLLVVKSINGKKYKVPVRVRILVDWRLAKGVFFFRYFWCWSLYLSRCYTTFVLVLNPHSVCHKIC
jgi:hypothetical protein